MTLLLDDECITPSDGTLDSYGWTLDKFTPDSYAMYDSDTNTIIIPLVRSISPGKGNFVKLCKKLNKDYNIEVRYPNNRMLYIINTYLSDICTIYPSDLY
jgi:hypothetical protein